MAKLVRVAKALALNLLGGLRAGRRKVKTLCIQYLGFRGNGGRIVMANPSVTSNYGGNVEPCQFGNPSIGRSGGAIVDGGGCDSFYLNWSVGGNASSSNQEVSCDLSTDGKHSKIVVEKSPSTLENADGFMQWYEEQSKQVDQILAQGNEQLLNAKQCQHMIKKLQEVVGMMLEIICTSRRAKEFKRVLKDLNRVVVKVFALVKECGGEDLLVGAIYQLENKESFRELLLELECCFKATCGLSQKIAPEYGVMSLDLGSAPREYVERDRASLKGMLENSKIDFETPSELVELRDYLLKRLKDLEEVKGGELNTLEFAKCGKPERSKQLGATGGYGSVYESKWLGLTCATKILNNNGGDCDEWSMENFCNEASILAGLNHPNLVKFIGMGRGEGGWPFLMMEKMEKSVAGLMKEHTIGEQYNLPLDVVIDVMQQVASGMYYLHDMHVAHRDLKPDNVLWTTLDERGQSHASSSSFGQVKLTDFGISKIEVGSGCLRPDNQGTSFYRAPEVLKKHEGMKASYFQADVYSFGIMCAELLYGKVELKQPYHPMKDFFEKKLGMRCKLPSGCEKLTTLIWQCCAYQPLERPTFSEIWKRIRCLKSNHLIGREELILPTCSLEKVNAIEQGGVSPKLYGVDEKVKEVQVLLQGANLLGIVGMGGVGKSTLAQAILDAEEGNQKFNRRCLHYIGRLESDEDCLQVLKNMLEKLDVEVKVEDLVHGRNELEKALMESNILLILDDVWDWSHLSNIISTRSLSLQRKSTLIVCSRNWDLIKDHVKEKYHLEPLSNKGLCMDLFATHCFGDGKEHIPREVHDVGLQIVEACKGLPLSLKVLGAFLSGKERLRSWERVLQRLKRGRSPQSGNDWEIFEVLKISFDGLEEMEKSMFLDICCFYLQDVYGTKLSMDKDCSKLLTHGESTLMKAFETLINRSLIEAHGRRLQMHDQLRDMGYKIVEWKVHAQRGGIGGESKYVGSRLRLLNSNKLEQMKEKNFDFGNIEGISCVIRRSDVSLEKHLMEGRYPNMRVLLIETDLEEMFNFTTLMNLTTLDFRGSLLKKFPQGLENLKLLRCMRFNTCTSLELVPRELAHIISLTSLGLWGCSKLSTIPKELGNLSSLTSLDLSGCSKLSTIPKALGNLSSLTSLDLSWCSSLLTIPKELGNLPSLTSLDLSWCSNLLTIPKDLGNLSFLTSLDLSRCSNLSTIPKELGNLSSLTSLDLSRCSKLLTIPKEVGNLCSLTSLDLSLCSNLLTVPKDLGNLSSLTSLDLSKCSNLSTIPTRLGNLSSLKSLRLQRCSNLSTIPKELGNLSSLTSLDLSRCFKLLTIPKEVGNLSSLTSLDLRVCSKLLTIPKELGNLSSLTSFDLSACSKLSTIPKEWGDLSSLTLLELSECSKLLTIPKELGNLSSLTSLDLSWCFKLLTIPKELGNLSSLTSLDLSWCSKLLTIPKELGTLSSLTSLELSECSKLSTIPKELGNLSSLTSLDLSWCSKLSTIPKGLGNLSSLKSLCLQRCSILSTIPKELGNLSSLTSLDLSWCSKLSTIPKELGNLLSLTSLDLSWCSKLSTIPKELGNLSSLASLDLRVCSKLLIIPKELGNLLSLTSLDLSWCSKLSTIPKEVGNLSSLTSLMLSSCSKLLTIPKELGNLLPLTSLDLSWCSKLSTIPKEVGNLSSLTSLHLGGCSKLSTIPEELGKLSSLASLDLRVCSKLLIIPKELGNLSSLTSFKLNECSKLLTIPKELGNLSSLTSLDLSWCSKLSTIPKEVGNLSSLTSLHLGGCSKLSTIPKELGKLSSLASLDLRVCSKLLTIPTELRNLSSLTSLDLSRCSSLLTIPKGLGNLSSLKSLCLRRCSNLSTIPKELGKLSSLTSLDLSKCSKLPTIPKELGNLSSLTLLDLSQCSKLLTIPKELGNLSSLTSLDLRWCSKLSTIPEELGNLSSLTSLKLS